VNEAVPILAAASTLPAAGRRHPRRCHRSLAAVLEEMHNDSRHLLMRGPLRAARLPGRLVGRADGAEGLHLLRVYEVSPSTGSTSPAVWLYDLCFQIRQVCLSKALDARSLQTFASLTMRPRVRSL